MIEVDSVSLLDTSGVRIQCSPVMSRHESQFYVAGGTLGLEVPSYVERQADRDLLTALDAGELCYVLTSRQMGKSSLMVRTARKLRERGHRVISIDLTALGQNLTSEQWYDGMLFRIGQQSGLEEATEAAWKALSHLGPVQRFFMVLESALLSIESSRWVVFIDELDVVRSLPFGTDEFFAAIRESYTRRADEPAWRRLCFCLLGVATPGDLVRDARVTPFNIGRRVELHDFTPEEAVPLARGMGRAGGDGPGLSGEECLKRVLYWTNGHPYLTQRLCRAVSDAGAAGAQARSAKELVDRICEDLFLSQRARDRDDNLVFVRERLLREEKEKAALLHGYHQVLRGRLKAPLTRSNDATAALRLAGLVRVEDDFLRVRNRIYRKVFSKRWVRANMPDAELRRQRTAFWRGVFRAAAATVLLLAILGGLLVYAQNQNLKAREMARQQRQQLYTAHLNVAQRSIEAGNSARASELLNDYRPKPGEEDLRGFEWRYLWQLCQQDEVLRMDAGAGTRSDVAFGPQGQLLAVAGDDERIRIFNAATSAVLGEIHAGQGTLLDLKFAPGGFWIVVSKANQGVMIFETMTAKLRRRLPPGAASVTDARFLNRGRWLSLFDSDRAGKVVDLMSGRTLFSKQWTGLETVAGVDPAAHQFATVRPADRVLEIRDWKDQGVLQLSLEGMFSTGAFSKDGFLYAAALADGPILVFDLRLRRMTSRLSSPRAASTLVFSQDGRRIAAGTEDSQIRVWRLEGTPVLERTLKGHTAPASALVFSPEGRHLLSGSSDQTVRLWDLETTWAADNQRVMETDTPVYSSDFSPDGKTVISSEAGGTIRIWDAYRGLAVGQITADPNEVGSCTKVVDGGRLLLTGFGPAATQAVLWDLGTLKRAATLAKASDNLLSWSVGARRSLLVAGTSEGIRRWDLAARKELDPLMKAEGRISFVSVSPDGEHLLFAGSDRRLRLADPDSGKTPEVLTVRPVMPSAGYFFPDNNKVAVLFVDGRAQVWSLRDRRLIHSFYAGQTTLAISPDMRTFAAASGPMVWFWNTRTSQEIYPLTGHRSSVGSVVFSPDGNAMLTSSEDRTLRIWRAPSLSQIRAIDRARTRAAREISTP